MIKAIYDVEEYAHHVFEPGDIVELRTIGNGPVRKFWKQAKDLSDLVPELKRLNQTGQNIYVGPNPRIQENISGDKNVTVCRCLFTDFDGIDAGDGCGRWDFVEARIEESGLPMPTLTVFSGHGIHAYWRLTEPLPVDQWRDIQERLIFTLDADPACKNPERLMRLPGFLNHKHEPSVGCFKLFAEAK